MTFIVLRIIANCFEIVGETTTMQVQHGRFLAGIDLIVCGLVGEEH